VCERERGGEREITHTERERGIEREEQSGILNFKEGERMNDEREMGK
jgi:hypothetical protein